MKTLILAFVLVSTAAIAAPPAAPPHKLKAVPLKVSSATTLSDADRATLVQKQAAVDNANRAIANAATQTTNAATNLTKAQAAFAEFWASLKANYSAVHDGSSIDAVTGKVTGP